MLVVSLLFASVTSAVSPAAALGADVPAPAVNILGTEGAPRIMRLPPGCVTQPQDANTPAPEPRSDPISVADKTVDKPGVGTYVKTGPDGYGVRTINLNNVGQAPDLLWRPGDNPDEGLYAPVMKMVDGCEVSTP